MADITIHAPENALSGWRAVRYVPQAWVEARMGGTHVLGGAEGYPPFVEARGRTPVEAIENLYRRIGECWLLIEAWEARQVLIGAQSHEIKKRFEITLEQAEACVAALKATPGAETMLLGALEAFVVESNARRRGEPHP